jgi:plastocyanin
MVAVFGAALMFGVQPASAWATTPGIAANASPTTTVGLQIFDHANLMGAATPTGTITFKLFTPTDASCSHAIFQSTVPVSPNGSADSSRFWSGTTGVFHWTASYSGDENNNSASTTCGDQSQAVTVSKHFVGAAVTAAQTGDVVHATFALSGGFSPTGTATFTVAGPTDTWCSGPPVYTARVPLNGAGSYDSGSFRATAPGVYKFRVRYDGDDNNYGAGPTGCTDQTAAVTVLPSPTAVFTPSTYTPRVGQTVSYDATRSSTPADHIVCYRWVWNDGTPDGAGPRATHVFTTPGLRSVTLYITDSNAETDAEGHSADVEAAMPTAVFTPSTYTAGVGQAVSLDATRSSTTADHIVSYRWVWADGTPDGAGPTPTHAFTAPGRYSVTLYITDSNGQMAAAGHSVTVWNALATAFFTPSTYTAGVGQVVSFDASHSSTTADHIVSYRWVWNDGTADGTGATATHAFATPGLHSVALYITDSGGQTAAAGHGITVA